MALKTNPSGVFLSRSGTPTTLYRHVLTACNAPFYDALIVLIESLYRNAFEEFYQIHVYDIGLTESQLKELGGIPRVNVIDMPDRKKTDAYIKSYAFKIDMMHLAQYHIQTNLDKTLLLYLDAGVLVNKSLAATWKVILEKDFYIADMSDRTAWNKSGDNIRLFNCCPDVLVEELEIPLDILAKPLLRPGIFGFRLNSPFYRDVIAQAFDLARTDPGLIAGDKFAGKPASERSERIQKLIRYCNGAGIDRCTDNFIGCRHDQFLFTWLIHSQNYIYERASGMVMDVTDTQASKRNHDGEFSQSLSLDELSGGHRETFLIHRNTVRRDFLPSWAHPRYPSDTRAIVDRVEGANVAIIGPAPHVAETNQGKIIDAYDLVFRINRYRAKPARFAPIGRRCDGLMHCVSETDATGGEISEVNFTTDRPMIIFAYPLLADSNIPSTFQPHYGNLYNYKRIFEKYKGKFDILVPDDRPYLSLETVLGSRPNTGFIGILTLLAMNPKELYVSGFTFFAGGYDPAYREETESDVMGKMAEHGFHDQESQLNYFVKNIAREPALRMDQKLLAIVNDRLASYKRANEYVTIVGNGPSLSAIDLRTLRSGVTASFNRAYIVYEERNFYPTFYYCIDKAVLLNCLDDIRGLLDGPISRFVLLDCEETRDLASHPKVELVGKTTQNAPYFGDVATFAIWRLAEMGYSRFDVLGCDCNYVEDIEALGVDVETNDHDPARRIVLKPRKGSVDPNHFIPNYFGEGTEYSVPRGANHLKAWVAVSEMAKAKDLQFIFGTPSKASYLFEFEPYFTRLRAHEIASMEFALAPPREYPRDCHAGVDETRVVASLLNGRRGEDYVMIDVGAHFGITASMFDELDWTIHCFEPDPANRRKLQKRHSDNPRIMIDPRAVADKPAKEVSFFTSPESTGISGLLAFRDTHKEAEKVEVTTIREVVKERDIKHIDFLKIDVEGYDLNVLKGVPWNELAPDVVECEFEDAKTLKLGHDWKHVADYLESKGYTVYVSEWHPIIRYGIAHDWRRVVPYRGCELAPDAWGNFLAFREDPGFEAVAAAFEKLLKRRNPAAVATTTPAAQAKAPQFEKKVPAPAPAMAPEVVAEPRQPTPSPDASESAPHQPQNPRWYAPLGNAVQRYAPALFPALRAMRRGVWRLAGARPVWVAGLGALAALALVVFGPGSQGSRLIWAAATLGTGLLAGFGVLGWRFYRHIQALSEQNRSLAAEIARTHELAEGREARAELLLRDQQGLNQRLSRLDGLHAKSQQALEERIATIQTEQARAELLLRDQQGLSQRLSRLDGLHAKSQQALEERIATIQTELARAAEALNGEIVRTSQAARSGAEAALRAEISTLEARLSDANSATAEALTTELSRAQAELEQKIKARAASTSASFGRASQAAQRREAKLRAEISSLEARLSDTTSVSVRALEAELSSAKAGLEQKMESRAASTRASFGRVSQAAKRRETELQKQIESLSARLEASLADESVESTLEELQQRLNALLEEQSRLLEKAAEQAAAHDEQVRKDLAESIAALSGEIEALEARQSDAASANGQAVESRLEELQQCVESLKDETNSRVQEAMKDLNQRLAGMEDKAESGAKALDATRQELEESMKALRQGLEQRMFAEIDEYAKGTTSELIARIDAIEAAQTQGDEAYNASLDALRDELQRQLGSVKEETDTRVQAAMKELTEQLAGMGDKAESGARALDTAKQELEDSMKALRQGLEQRMAAEIEEKARNATTGLISRLDAVEAAQAERDKSMTSSVSALKKALEEELSPQIGDVREAVESARNAAAEARKTAQTGKVESARILERTRATERQIGALRYPDAPNVFVYFGHHKCASRFFRREVFGCIAESTGAGIRQYKIKEPPFHYSRLDDLDLPNIDFSGLGKNGRDVVLFANATKRSLKKIQRSADDWRGLRVIRDPRQVLISNYFHHKGEHPDEAAGWIWDQLKEEKPILNELPEEQGILHELDNISRHVIEDLILPPFDDERIMTLRLEDFSQDPGGHLLKISEFLKVPDVAGINFDNKEANPESGPWKKYFTSRIRETFKERYGQALIDLGYAEDMDW